MLNNIKLQKHQSEAVSFLLNGGSIIALDPGMGKTYTALYAMSELMSQDPELRSIIIVPTTALEPFNKSFSSVPFQCYNAYKNHKSIPESARVILFTYEELKYAVSLASTGKWMSIFDEAHLLLDSSTSRYKEAKTLKSLSTRCWGLTGTPIINSIPNLYNFIDFFYPGKLGTYEEFEDKYLVMDKRKPTPVLRRTEEPGVTKRVCLMLNFCDDIKNSSELRSILNSMVFRAVRDYNVEFHEVFSTMTSFESMWYDKATEGYRDINGYRITNAARYYNQQEVASGSDEHLISMSGKMKNLVKTVEKIVSRGEGALVYCTSKKTISMVYHYINGIGRNTYVLTGEMKMKDRQVIQRILQPGDICIMDDAGVASMNLQAVNNVVIVENSWSSGIFTQLIGRVCRVDSTYDKQNVYVLLTKGTVDETKYNNIKRKLGVQQALFGTSTATGRGLIKYPHLGMGWDDPVEGSYWELLKEQGYADDSYYGPLQGMNKVCTGISKVKSADDYSHYKPCNTTAGHALCSFCFR